MTRTNAFGQPWFALVDTDWPRVRDAHPCWLNPENFRADGDQRTPVSEAFATLEA